MSKYVDGFTQFSSNPEEQHGNYIVLHATAAEGATIKYQSVYKDGTLGNLVTLTSDGILVVRLTANSDKMKFIATKNGVDNVLYYSLDGLTLEDPEAFSITLAAGGNCTKTGAYQVYEGQTATITIEPATGYDLPSTITVVGAQGAYDNTTGVVVLSGPTANITVTCVCTPKVYTITTAPTNCTVAAGSDTSISYGSTASVTFAASSGYVLPSTITVNGDTGASGSGSGVTWTYDSTTGVVSLSNATADVSIAVVAEAEQPAGGLTPFVDQQTATGIVIDINSKTFQQMNEFVNSLGYDEGDIPVGVDGYICEFQNTDDYGFVKRAEAFELETTDTRYVLAIGATETQVVIWAPEALDYDGMYLPSGWSKLEYDEDDADWKYRAINTNQELFFGIGATVDVKADGQAFAFLNGTVIGASSVGELVPFGSGDTLNNIQFNTNITTAQMQNVLSRLGENVASVILQGLVGGTSLPIIYGTQAQLFVIHSTNEPQITIWIDGVWGASKEITYSGLTITWNATNRTLSTVGAPITEDVTNNYVNGVVFGKVTA